MGTVSRTRIAWLVALAAVSIICGAFFGDDLRGSEKSSEYIGVTFSVLAATLFAVISIIGDPSMLLPGNWRVGWESAKAIQDDLHRFNFIFYVYLVILGLLVVTELVKSSDWVKLYFLFDIFAGLSVFGFLLSLALPSSLAKIQSERLKQEIRERRARKEQPKKLSNAPP